MTLLRASAAMSIIEAEERLTGDRSGLTPDGIRRFMFEATGDAEAASREWSRAILAESARTSR